MPSLGITAGLRGVETRSDGGERDEVYSGIIGADWRPTFLPGASLLMEYEQDFKESDNWRLTLGGDYQWNPKLRFYALNEISSAETGFFGLGDGVQTNFTTKVGAEYQMTEEISGFSEFRQSGSTASDGGVANGVRGQWALTEQLAMRMSAEHVEPISDEDTRSSSATLGFAYDNEETGIIWRNDVEVERDEVGMGVFTNTAFGYELDKDLTVLARNRLAVDLRGDNRIRDRLRFGLAYRPEFETRVKALALYEFEIDDTVELTEQAHRWSFGGTYSPNDDIRMNAKYAGEHNDIDGPGFSDTSTLHLGRAGIEFDFGKDRFERDRFALGGHVAGFTDNAGSDVTLGVGIELKVNVMKNVQVGVGYNHIDVDEDRLRDLYHSGLYARIRLKLDESIWDEFDNLGLTTAPGID
jgi:opacity protein-like surface antigen